MIDDKIERQSNLYDKTNDRIEIISLIKWKPI
jgi:hypothetical protein